MKDAQRKMPTKAKPKKSQSAELVELTERVGFLHSPAEEPFARLVIGEHVETWPLRSKGFKRWLARAFHAKHGKPPSAQAFQDALGVLEGKATFDGPEMPVFTRIGEHDGAIFLDLGNRDWQVVKITPHGWEIVNRSPAVFRRSKGMRPLPVPVRDGRINELRPFVNVADDDGWRLLVAWLIAAFRPRGPYPLLCLHGEQGSAKSTTARTLRSLFDPNTAPLRSEPREPRDLMIAATNAWLVAFDNLSHIPTWLSDALCRLATGGGFATRELYTDADEMIFDAMRPCILTSIEDLAVRGDLLERAIILTLPSIPDDKRRTEEDYDRDLDAARPRILGALLDAVSAALSNLPSVKLDRLPRMADFAKWVCAAEPALGWDRGAFGKSYQGNQQDANELALEAAAVVVAPLQKFLEANGPTWEGTASDLLTALATLADDEQVRTKEWPKKANVLSGLLRRLAPNLRKVGVNVLFDRKGKKRARTVKLEKCGESSSASSAHNGNTEKAGATGGRSQGAADGPRALADDDGDKPNAAETTEMTHIADNADDADDDSAHFSNDGAASLPDDWREQYEERAGIMEQDGGLPREQAEASALAEIHKEMRQRGLS